MSALIKVLVVDDSALIRQLLSTILNSDPMIDVVGTAPDPLKARELIKKLNPDVITLDIEMPKMNGIDFLKKIMTLRPMPVVMISSLTQHGADISLEALEIGAVDVIAKPHSDMQRGLGEQSKTIIKKVKVAATAKVRALESVEVRTPQLPDFENSTFDNRNLIVIGASTGGVEALRTVLADLPDGMPPIFVVQHMPKQFTTTFAKRLNALSNLTVLEAEDGMVAKKGHVYIAPGDKHLKAVEEKDMIICRVEGEDAVNGHVPAVSVLFNSACDVNPTDTVGVMLSGMGKDGAMAMKQLKERGAFNIGQDEKSCVVYGMPKAAYDCGAIHKEYDLKHIAKTLITLCRTNG